MDNHCEHTSSPPIQLRMNVLGFGKQAKDFAYDQLCNHLQRFSELKIWRNYAIRLSLCWSDSTLFIQSGRYNLPLRSIKVVSDPFKGLEIFHYPSFLSWSKAYALIVAICDVEDLLDDEDTLHQVAAYRSAMLKIGRYSDLILLILHPERIISIQNCKSYKYNYLGVCSALTGHSYNHSQILPEQRERWNTIFTLNLNQRYIPLRTKIRKKRFLWPWGLACQLPMEEFSGYAEVLQIALKKLYKDITTCFSFPIVIPANINN